MELWNRLERGSAGLLGALALAVGAYQIFGRYISPRLAITWGDEVIVLAMVESERAIQTILVGDAPPGAPAPTVS